MRISRNVLFQPVEVPHFGFCAADDKKSVTAQASNRQVSLDSTALVQPLGVDDAAIDDVEKTLPSGITVQRNIFRQADFIEAAVGNVELALLDLRELLMLGQPNAEKADPIVMKLADLAAKSVDNRVQFFIKSKDVLTIDQKRLLSHMLGLN